MHSPSLPELPAPERGLTGWPWTDESAALPGLMPDGAPWPRVTVVTPSYNQGAFIEETIRSVLLQGYPDLEYIVVDGGSTDETAAVLKRYEQWLHWTSEPDRGQTDAINKGLRMATGQIMAYLNSDDTYLPGGIGRIAGAFARRPEAGLVYGECRVVDECSRALGMLPARPFDLRRTIERGEFLPQQAVFWRRSVVERVGLFDESLHYAMDFDFFIRAGRAFKVHYLPEPVAAFRMQSGSKTVSQAERHWREALAVSERHGLRPLNPWFWIRRARHWGLRMLPRALQQRVRERLGRAQDPHLYAGRR